MSTAHATVPHFLSGNYYKNQEIGNHSVEFQKGWRTYFGVRVHGAGGVLQSKASDVLLYISKGLQAFVYGYIHTDTGSFLQEIPEDHCLVAPIVEYHYEATNDVTNKKLFFRIKVPHCVSQKDDLKSIQVKHGDIHKGVTFTRLPISSSYFQVDEKYVTIYTRHFSQFICTSCNKICKGRGKAFMFGRVMPLQTIPSVAALRLFLCSPLLDITDYKKVS